MTSTVVAGEKISQEMGKAYPVKAYAAQSAASGLAPAAIRRREPGATDVQIDILYCGVCHSDLHQVRNEWENMMPTVYPCVPGHEIVGRVAKAGSAVKKFKEGGLAAVGCMVDSDRVCPNCRAGNEQFCDSMPTFTYNAEDKHLGGVTYGGYSDSIVVDEAFVLRVPEKLDPAATAPLLCAGITTYSPMRHWNVRKGQKVGVVGLGGLGHMGVKFAHAFGAHVVLFTTSANKVADGLRLGADEVVISKNDAEMAKHAGQLRLYSGHGFRGTQLERLSRSGEARRNVDSGRGISDAVTARGWELAVPAAFAGGIDHRRHSRNPGDAGFLCRAWHCLRYRADSRFSRSMRLSSGWRRAM